jgi:DNA-binding PadR family transcriptional regulator
MSFVELPQMPVPPRKRHLGAQQRLALQLLAGTPFGATEATMVVNGFKRQTLVRLIRAGLATTQSEINVGGQAVGRITITDAGRRALETLFWARGSVSGSRARNAASAAGVGFVRVVQLAISRGPVLPAGSPTERRVREIEIPSRRHKPVDKPTPTARSENE